MKPIAKSECTNI